MLNVQSLHVENRLDITSFEVKSGDAMLITGSNGAGKSTLMDCIAGVINPSSGSVSIQSKTIPAYLPQSPPRPFPYTVAEYLMIGATQTIESNALEEFNIEPLMGQKITSLSAGQWQRVAIAKVLQANHLVIVLDEPDAPLDDNWSARLAMVIDRQLTKGKVIVLTLHRPEIRNHWKYQQIRLTPISSS